eukprot:8041074-Ditylum_brightwellii.AAC.1
MRQLKSHSTDFSNTFAQAGMKVVSVYITPPLMMSSFPRDKEFKLNKSLYGQVDPPRIWYDKLRANWVARGFTACKADPYLFISKK